MNNLGKMHRQFNLGRRLYSKCKTETEHYSYGLNENDFSKMTKNTKNIIWTWNECKSKWNSKKSTGTRDG